MREMFGDDAAPDGRLRACAIGANLDRASDIARSQGAR